jgi:hypothetical protein
MQEKRNAVHSTVLPIMRRTLSLVVLLVLSVFVSFMWFSMGFSWLYDDGGIPILSCPQFALYATGSAPTGSRCQMTLSFSSVLNTTIANAGLLAMDPGVKATGLCSLSSLKNPDYIYCYWDNPCQDTCQVVGTGKECPDSSALPNPKISTSSELEPQCYVKLGQLDPLQVACFSVSADSYCDTAYNLTPANVVAMRGIVLAAMLIVVIWLIAEILLYVVERDLRKELAAGRAAQAETLPAKKAELRRLVELSWAHMHSKEPIFVSDSSEAQIEDNISVASQCASPRVAPSPSARRTVPRIAIPISGTSPKLTSGFSSPLNSILSPKKAQKGDPGSKFTSAAWKRRLLRYYELKNQGKTEFRSKEFARSLALTVFYFSLIVLTLWVILRVSPQQLSTTDSVMSSFTGQVSLWAINSWLDVIIFADVILDFGLFLIAAFVIRWPKPSIFSKYLQKKIAIIQGKSDNVVFEPNRSPNHKNSSSHFPGEHDFKRRKSLSSVSSSSEAGSELSCTISSLGSQDTKSLSFVMKQSLASDCCLMIACHESTITQEKAETFANTLRCALNLFPPSHVFICDNGASVQPADGTQMVAHQVHPDINYLYIPEGNKTFAFYWCNRYWIPLLEKSGHIDHFRYALIIDDDVPLPGDLHIPHEHLHQHPEIKVVHFPLTATCPDPKDRGLLLTCQDVEYKLAALHKQFQSKLSRCLSCHGAIALWERKAMEEVFFEHDTVFHGEDMYMGLCLLRRRDDSIIMSASQTVVPTYAPNSFLMLFRQRVKSWELTSHRKTFTYLTELLSPTSFCHRPSLVLKPYFLQELVTILLDWLRVFLLCGLFLRDWLGFVLMTSFFVGLMYFQVALFSLLVLRSRKELRPSFFTFLMFPFYRLTGLLFRICALCHNILVYSHNRTAMKIGRREDEIRDIPPTPPCHAVDWFTVWTPKH